MEQFERGYLLLTLFPLLGALLGSLLLSRHVVCHLLLADLIDSPESRMLGWPPLEGRGPRRFPDLSTAEKTRKFSSPIDFKRARGFRKDGEATRDRLAVLFSSWMNCREFRARIKNFFLDARSFFSPSETSHERDTRPRPLARLRRRVHVLRTSRERGRHRRRLVSPRARRHRDAEQARSFGRARDHGRVLPCVRVSRGSLRASASRR